MPNGPDLEYDVRYSETELGSSSGNVTTRSLSTVLTDLEPFTNYSVSVRACTTGICGLFTAATIVETEQEGASVCVLEKTLLGILHH